MYYPLDENLTSWASVLTCIVLFTLLKHPATPLIFISVYEIRAVQVHVLYFRIPHFLFGAKEINSFQKNGVTTGLQITLHRSLTAIAY